MRQLHIVVQTEGAQPFAMTAFLGRLAFEARRHCGGQPNGQPLVAIARVGDRSDHDGGSSVLLCFDSMRLSSHAMIRTVQDALTNGAFGTLRGSEFDVAAEDTIAPTSDGGKEGS